MSRQGFLSLKWKLSILPYLLLHLDECLGQAGEKHMNLSGKSLLSQRAKETAQANRSRPVVVLWGEFSEIHMFRKKPKLLDSQFSFQIYFQRDHTQHSIKRFAFPISYWTEIHHSIKMSFLCTPWLEILYKESRTHAPFPTKHRAAIYI